MYKKDVWNNTVKKVIKKGLNMKGENVWDRMMSGSGQIDPTLLYEKAKLFKLEKSIIDGWIEEYKTLHNRISEEGKSGMTKNYKALDFIADMHSLICLDQISFNPTKEFGIVLREWGKRLIELSTENELAGRKIFKSGWSPSEVN